MIETNQADLKKVVNGPQAENSEFYNILKITWYATKDDQKNAYELVMWNDQLLKSWFSILNLQPSTQFWMSNPLFLILLPQIPFT